ncbi:ARM repeat-containing protein, partial [Gloeophyllum trabeum ATCC 11539]
EVRGLLDKLTMERFESTSNKIIDWANKSEKEKDGRILIQVIHLIIERAIDEAALSDMYARLCRKMTEQISPNVQVEGIRNPEGKPITGGQLFRKYLLDRCQEDFERGWAAQEAPAAAAKVEASENEATLHPKEYLAAQKARRQGLGLMKFIGELFKLQILTERIMHECIKKLLSNVDNPEEEEIESLCQLLTTVGQILDTPRAKLYMDIYFTRMKELAKNPKVSSRMQCTLQDVIELRERRWIPPTMIALWV